MLPQKKIEWHFSGRLTFLNTRSRLLVEFIEADIAHSGFLFTYVHFIWLFCWLKLYSNLYYVWSPLNAYNRSHHLHPLSALFLTLYNYNCTIKVIFSIFEISLFFSITHLPMNDQVLYSCSLFKTLHGSLHQNILSIIYYFASCSNVYIFSSLSIALYKCCISESFLYLIELTATYISTYLLHILSLYSDMPCTITYLGIESTDYPVDIRTVDGRDVDVGMVLTHGHHSFIIENCKYIYIYVDEFTVYPGNFRKIQFSGHCYYYKGEGQLRLNIGIDYYQVEVLSPCLHNGGELELIPTYQFL